MSSELSWQLRAHNEAAAAAALAATCHRMRRLMSYCTTAAKMRLFGCSQQLTPLLQRRLMIVCRSR